MSTNRATVFWLVVVALWALLAFHTQPPVLSGLRSPFDLAIVSSELFCINIIWFIGIYELMLCVFPVHVPTFKKYCGVEAMPVAILYTTKNDFVEAAALSCVHQQYAKFHVYILDDGDDPGARTTIDAFQRRFAETCTVVRRTSRVGYKAGNLNNALKLFRNRYPYFAVVDADTVLPLQFVTETLKYFVDDKVGFVQALQCTPANRGCDTLCAALSPGTDIYWRSVVLPSSRIGFVMFHGHAGVVRTQTWFDVGGFPEVISEDLAFSTAARVKGYKGVIAEDVVCNESFPPDYEAFCRRQRKYVCGLSDYLTRQMIQFLRSKSVPVYEKIDRCVGSLILLMPCLTAIWLVGISCAPAHVISRLQTTPLMATTVVMWVCMLLPAVLAFWRQPLKLFAFLVCATAVHLSLTFRATFDAFRTVLKGANVFPVTGDRHERVSWGTVLTDCIVDVVGLGLCSIALVHARSYGVILIALAVSGSFLFRYRAIKLRLHSHKAVAIHRSANRTLSPIDGAETYRVLGLGPVMTLRNGFLVRQKVHEWREPLADQRHDSRGEPGFSLATSNFYQALLLAIGAGASHVCRNPSTRFKWVTIGVVLGVLTTALSVLPLHPEMPSVSIGIAERAYPSLVSTVSDWQDEFYIFDGSESWRNHGLTSLSGRWFGQLEPSPLNHGYGPEVFASSPSVLSMVHVDTACVYGRGFPGECSTNTNSLDRLHGTAVQVRFDALAPGEFAGINFEEPANYGVLRSGNGYDLQGFQRVTFKVASPRGGDVARFGVSEKNWPYHRKPATWTGFLPVLDSLGLSTTDLPNVHVPFPVGAAYDHTPGGATILIDNVRFEPPPQRTRPVLGLPLATRTFPVVMATDKLSGRVPIPPDAVNANLSTIYESSLALLALLDRPTGEDVANAKMIADTLVYALGHDSKDLPIPSTQEGAGGLHNGYGSREIALLNTRFGAAQGEMRLAGFSIGSNLCGPAHFCVVLDGASGGNNAYAILALLRSFEVTQEERYLNAASEIGMWIGTNLSDSSTRGYGGYFVGYPDDGQTPKTLQRGKSTENNADIFAAFSELGRIELARGNSRKASEWMWRANAAGDFVIKMYDAMSGQFFAGTIPPSQAKRPGISPNGSIRGNDVVNTYGFLDANTTAILALAGSTRYRHAIDWRRPVEHAVQRFGAQVQAGGQQYAGFNIVQGPTSGPNGIAWEFTAQMVSAMRFVDYLYRESAYEKETDFYLSQIHKAQISGPFGDGEGIVAATLENGDELPPYEQCLSTPFQCIPERVGLAATTWSIFAARGINPLFNGGGTHGREATRYVNPEDEPKPPRR